MRNNVTYFNRYWRNMSNNVTYFNGVGINLLDAEMKPDDLGNLLDVKHTNLKTLPWLLMDMVHTQDSDFDVRRVIYRTIDITAFLAESLRSAVFTVEPDDNTLPVEPNGEFKYPFKVHQGETILLSGNVNYEFRQRWNVRQMCYFEVHITVTSSNKKFKQFIAIATILSDGTRSNFVLKRQKPLALGFDRNAGIRCQYAVDNDIYPPPLT